MEVIIGGNRLKLRLRLENTTILGEVLAQHHTLYPKPGASKILLSMEGIEIRSAIRPELITNALYIRGQSSSCDNQEFSYTYSSSTEATEILAKICACVGALQHVPTETEVENSFSPQRIENTSSINHRPLLDIALYRYGTVVVGSVLHQEESMRKSAGLSVLASTGDKSFKIVSSNNPSLTPSTLYVRGKDTERDNDVFCCGFPNVAEATAVCDKIISLVGEVNARELNSPEKEEYPSMVKLM